MFCCICTQRERYACCQQQLSWYPRQRFTSKFSAEAVEYVSQNLQRNSWKSATGAKFDQQILLEFLDYYIGFKEEIAATSDKHHHFLVEWQKNDHFLPLFDMSAWFDNFDKHTYKKLRYFVKIFLINK